jgi:hypothetical protein
MATPQQLRGIFAPILADYPDLVLRGRWLVRPPIETAIVGLYIGRTSSARSSRMALSVMPLSRFSDPSALGFSRAFEVERAIGGPPPGRLMPGESKAPPRIVQDMFSPDYQAHLLRNFNVKVPLFLNSVRSFDDVQAWVRTFCGPPQLTHGFDLSRGWLAAMNGEFGRAADHVQAHLEMMGNPRSAIDAESHRQEEQIRDVLLTGDAQAIAAFLHAREERTVTHFKLQRFWRRTPFPFERT